MKSSIALFLLTVGTLTASAQGTVTFQNGVAFQTPDPTGGNRLVYDCGSPLDPVNGVGLTGTQYVAELYAGTSAGSLAPVTASPSRFRNSTTSPSNRGKWNTFTIDLTPNATMPIPGINPGDTAFLQVKWWDWNANGGTTALGSSSFETKVTGPYGISQVFTYKVPPLGDLVPGDYFMEGLQAFALVPEPSAIALGVLGMAGLLLIRRRK